MVLSSDAPLNIEILKTLFGLTQSEKIHSLRRETCVIYLPNLVVFIVL